MVPEAPQSAHFHLMQGRSVSNNAAACSASASSSCCLSGRPIHLESTARARRQPSDRFRPSRQAPTTKENTLMFKLAILNESTVYSLPANLLSALQTQVTEHFAPVWGINAQLRV